MTMHAELSPPLSLCRYFLVFQAGKQIPSSATLKYGGSDADLQVLPLHRSYARRALFAPDRQFLCTAQSLTL